MSLDDHTAQEHLTPEERRKLLRAFADRMLLKVTAMDDPEDLPGVEKAVRVAAAIERVYSRCDRAERQIRDKTPDPRKAEAERAAHETAAIRARVELASTLEWADKRRRNLGQWWDAAGETVETPAVPAEAVPPATSEPPDTVEVPYIDYAARILKARPELASRRPVMAFAKPRPPPPS